MLLAERRKLVEVKLCRLVVRERRNSLSCLCLVSQQEVKANWRIDLTSLEVVAHSMRNFFVLKQKLLGEEGQEKYLSLVVVVVVGAAKKNNRVQEKYSKYL